MQLLCRNLPAAVQVLMARKRPCQVMSSVNDFASAWGEPGEGEVAWSQPHKYTCQQGDKWAEAWCKPSESSATRVLQVSEVSPVGTVYLSKSTCTLCSHQRGRPLIARETGGADVEDCVRRYHSACAVCRCKSDRKPCVNQLQPEDVITFNSIYRNMD